MSKVKSFESYDYNMDWYLIEMVIDEDSDNIDVNKFFLPDPELEESYWQVPYMEQYLDEDGCALISEAEEKPCPSVNPTRLAFFVFKFGTEILHTPYGDFDVTNALDLPDRLADAVEFV